MSGNEASDVFAVAMQGVIDRWCPKFSKETEARHIQVGRVLLHLNAYELDFKRVMAGEQPIRTDYPLPLPTKPATA